MFNVLRLTLHWTLWKAICNEVHMICIALLLLWPPVWQLFYLWDQWCWKLYSWREKEKAANCSDDCYRNPSVQYVRELQTDWRIKSMCVFVLHADPNLQHYSLIWIADIFSHQSISTLGGLADFRYFASLFNKLKSLNILYMDLGASFILKLGTKNIEQSTNGGEEWKRSEKKWWDKCAES